MNVHPECARTGGEKLSSQRSAWGAHKYDGAVEEEGEYGEHWLKTVSDNRGGIPKVNAERSV